MTEQRFTKKYFRFKRNAKPTKPTDKVYALGGLGEIGKNMYGIEYKNEIVLIDAGLDLIGAIPYFLQQLNIPKFGAPLTIALIRSKLDEHRLLASAELYTIGNNKAIAFQHLSVEFIRSSHSIPDAFSIAVLTPYGYVLHTGDFKFDLTPADLPPDIHRMAEIGSIGVLALLSESTNSEKAGSTPPELTVGQSIMEAFQACQGRKLFATFASNVHRLQQVVEAAIACNRKPIIIGRSMDKIFSIGQELGYIRVPEGMMIDVKEINQYASNQIAIICTGSQGEPFAALTRIAYGTHRFISIEPEDTVIFSSSPIPGNTISVNRSIDRLMRAGAQVISGSIMDIHTSGYGCKEDLKLMLQLMRPKYFIPIHGEYRMLLEHTRLAVEMGVSGFFIEFIVPAIYSSAPQLRDF